MKKIFTLLFFSLQVLTTYSQLCEAIDRTFGKDGIAIGFTTNANNQLAYPRNVVVQPDNKIIQAYMTNLGVSSGSFGLIRYHSDGRIDSSFGINGKVVTQVGNNESSPTKVTLQPDGKIVVVGNTYIQPGSDITIVRYNIDGSLDSGFGLLGKVLTSFGNYYDFATSVTLQDDKIIVVGGSSDQMNATAWAIARFNADGSPDNSFGVNGIIIKHLGRFIDYIGSFYYGTYASESAMAVVTQPDGKIIVAGQSYYLDNCYDYYGSLYCNNAFAMIRLNKDGSVDSSFGKNGKVSDSLKLQNSSSIVLQEDGKILATGYGFMGFVAARYNSNGAIDGSFGSGGIVENSMGGLNNNAQSNWIEIGSNGRIFIGGQAYYNSKSTGLILVLDKNGRTDSSFNRTGISTVNFGVPSLGNYLAGFANQGGKILVSGIVYHDDFNTTSGVARLLDSVPVIVPVISPPGSFGICPDGLAVLRSSEKGNIQWYRNNLEIIGAKDTIFTTGAGGTYTVIVSNTAGCGMSAPVLVTQHAGPPEIFVTYTSDPSYGYLSGNPGYKKYQWYLNNVIIAGADSSRYTPLQNGQYAVSVTDSNNCSRISAAYNFAILSITDITIGSAKLQFFPNPANTVINIEMPQQSYDKLFAEIYDLSGKRIQKIGINTGHNEIDVSNLPAGSYQLQVYSKKERSVRKILIAR